MVYHRFTYNDKNLRKEDFRLGFGTDSDLLSTIHQARIEYNKTAKEKLPLRSDFKVLYDKRDGYYIDGTKIETKHHPYHDKSLLNTKTGKVYSVDTVSIENWFGRHMTLGLREIGSKSHKHITYHNYTSNEPNTVKQSIENLATYKFIDKVYDPVENEK